MSKAAPSEDTNSETEAVLEALVDGEMVEVDLQAPVAEERGALAEEGPRIVRRIFARPFVECLP